MIAKNYENIETRNCNQKAGKRSITIKMTDVSKKQYIWSSKKIDNLDEMREFSVGGGYLYVHNKLNFAAYTDFGGNKVYLAGNAFCMDCEGKTPSDDIAAWDGQSTKQLTKFWTGRWVLFAHNELVTDACGMMSAFYINQGEQKYISSSQALLCEYAKLELCQSVKSEGLTWQILPDTLADGVKGLICTQKIIFKEDGFEVTFDSWIDVCSDMTTEEKCSKISQYLVNGLKNISLFSQRTPYLALTGGKDSRVVLSALLNAKVPFVAYTLEHKSISSSDKKIPAKLSVEHGFLHKYIKQSKISKSLLEDYYHFTANNTKGADVLFYACGQFSHIPKDAVIIRSGIFETGQTYGRSIAGNTKQSFCDGMKKYYSMLKTDENQRVAFEKWLEYISEFPIDNVDIRDRFYIEQRVAGWVAAIEQSMDLNDFVSIQIANCAALVSVLASATNEERQNLSLSYNVIGCLKPELLNHGINMRDFGDKFNYLMSILRSPRTKLKNFINKRKK